MTPNQLESAKKGGLRFTVKVVRIYTKQSFLHNESTLNSRRRTPIFAGTGFFLWKLASVLASWVLKPSCNFLRFPAMCRPKTAFFCRKMHRETHFSAGKPTFLQFIRGGIVVCFWMISPLNLRLTGFADHSAGVKAHKCQKLLYSLVFPVGAIFWNH